MMFVSFAELKVDFTVLTIHAFLFLDDQTGPFTVCLSSLAAMMLGYIAPLSRCMFVIGPYEFMCLTTAAQGEQSAPVAPASQRG